MIRVLHLPPANGDLQFRRSFAALQSAAGDAWDIAIRTIGRGGDYANLFWAVIGLRRLVNQFDVIHAWDERGVAAAALAGARRIVLTAPPSFSRRGPAILKRASRRAGLQIASTSPAQLEQLVARGIPRGSLGIAHPPAEVADTDPALRKSMRKQLGIRDDDFVLLAPGESTSAAEHERAVWAGSILHVVDERYRVLLWGRGDRIEIAAGLGDKLRQPGLVIVAERRLRQPVEMENLLAAADVMLVAGRRSAPVMPIAMAMAGGLPIVSVQRPHLAKILINGTTALTVPKPEPRALAQRVLDLRADSQRASAIAVGAKANAREKFSPEHFVDHYRGVYGRSPRVVTSPEAKPATAALSLAMENSL